MENNEMQARYDSIIEEIEERVNSNLIENPKFENAFLSEFNYICSKIESANINVEFSPNNDSFSLVSDSSIVNCSKKEFSGKNKSFFKTTFYLKNDNLFVESAQGTLIDKKEFENLNIKPGANYEAKFETSYAMKCFTKEGIEYSNSSYTDSYFIDTPYEETNLKDLVLSSFHKPVFKEYGLAQEPIHLMDAHARNTYRSQDNPEIICNEIADCTKDGYENIKRNKYTVHPMYPDSLRGGEKIKDND